MKTISVRELKAQRASVEAQVRDGETFEVLNQGCPTVRLVPVAPGKVLRWDGHVATASPHCGKSAEKTVQADRTRVR